jgi:hypothetical protein
MEEKEKIVREKSEPNQEKIQLKEIELKQRELDNNYEFARESLKYQIEDFKDQRRQQTSRQKIEIVLMFASIFLMFVFIIVAMVLNKDELLAEIIKVAGYIFGGGLTGYGLGVQQMKGKRVQAEKAE